MFDAHIVRKDFPILNRLIEGKKNIYMDTAASAQKPYVLILGIYCNSMDMM